MSTSPTVSIIIPVYNVREYIGECIQSIIKQSYRHIEIILVDDCGTDDSTAIAEELLKDTSLAWNTVRHATNRGLSAARNTGVSTATGEYLLFIDSDDFIPEDAVELLVQEALKTQAEMTCGNYLNYQDGEMSPGYATRTEETKLESNPLLAHISKYACPTAWNKLIKTSWYLKTGISFVEGLLHEDEPWSLSLAFQASKIAYADRITYYYRQRGNSIMSSELNLAKKADSRLYWLEYAKSLVPLCPVEHKYKYCFWINKNIEYVLSTIPAFGDGNRKTYFKKALSHICLTNGLIFKDERTKRLALMRFFLLVLNEKAAYNLSDYIVRPIARLKGKIKYLAARQKRNRDLKD